MNRRISAVMGGAMVLALAACSGGSSDAAPAAGATDAASQSWEGETLTVWIMEGTNPNAEGFFDKISADFTKETGATLDVQFQPWAGAHDKFVTAIAGGTGPDVAEVGTTWTAEFAGTGALTDLTDRVAEAGLKEDLVEGLVEAGTLDGKLYGMPWYAGVRSIVYNKALFEAAGITTMPTSWDELLAAVEALKAADPATIPFPIAGDSQYGAMPFIWGADGDIATLEGDTWTSEIDSAKSIEGLKFYTGLALDHGSSTAAANTWNEAALLQGFIGGNVGMMVSGNWTMGRIAADAPDMAENIGAFPIPARDGGVAGSFLGGSHLSIFSESPNQDLAWEFVNMMTTGEAAAAWGEEAGFFPGQVSALEASVKSDDPLVAPFAQQMLEAGRSVPVTPLYGQVQGAKIVEAMLQSILTGRLSVEEATAEAAVAMDKIFASGS
ncbi:MAG: sugar ABC transporter substrate-binding protein [Cellulomonas sp.]